MDFSSHKRLGYNAILIACVFVFGFFCLGMKNNATASCGDYLNHSGSQNIGSRGSAGQLGQKHSPVSDESSSPISKCRNGQCKAAPFSVPNGPARVFAPRQQPNHFLISSFKCACQLNGMLANSDDSLPIEPSLEILVPPPRATHL